VQDTRNENAPGLLPIKDDVLALLHAAQAWTDIVTLSAQSGIGGKPPATILQFAEVTDSLVLAPDLKGIEANAEQIALSATRETKPGHG
jgi:hypothetical protein